MKNKKRNKYDIFKGIFEIEKTISIPEVKVYFIDTDIDEDDNTYDDKISKYN